MVALARVAIFFVLLLSASVSPVAADPAPALFPPVVVSAQKSFYVLVDPRSEPGAEALVSLATATEINKALDPKSPADVLWAIPEPAWSIADFAKQCVSDKNAVGAVVLSYYSGDASHFWLLWQTQTTTFELSAQILACNRDESALPGNGVTPEIVAVVSTLHGAADTPWVERRTDASVPLLSGVALVALLNRSATKSQPTNVLTVATLGTAVLGQSFNKDIPGYSQPVRYRFDAHHIGTDLVAEMRWLCSQPEVGATASVKERPTADYLHMCKAFSWVSDAPTP